MRQTTLSPFLATKVSGNTVVGLRGDIDSKNAWAVRDGLVGLLDDGVSALIVSMMDTSFCDCAGIRGIVQAAHHAEILRIPLCVALPVTGPVRRMAELTGLGRELQVATGT